MKGHSRPLLGLLLGVLLIGASGYRPNPAAAETATTGKGVKGFIQIHYGWTIDHTQNGQGVKQSERCDTKLTFTGGTITASGDYEYRYTNTYTQAESDGEHTVVQETVVKGKTPTKAVNPYFNYRVDRHYVFGYAAYQAYVFLPTWDGYSDTHSTDNGTDTGLGVATRVTVSCNNPRAYVVNRPSIEGSVRDANATHFSGSKTAKIQDPGSVDVVGTYTLKWDLTILHPPNTQ
jgi:hypothetical protein